MATNLNRRANLLFLKKDSNYNTSIHELNKISLNFHLNGFNKKNNLKAGRLYNHYNNIAKNNFFNNKIIDHSMVNTYIKTSSPTTNFKSSNIDTSISNNDMTYRVKAKDNQSSREFPRDIQYKKHFHHKKINSHLLIKNNQILSDLFPNTTSNSNRAKDSLFNNKKISGAKTLRKKNIQIDTFNINNNNNTNINNAITKKLSTLLNNLNNDNKINPKIYLEKHQRIFSTDNNNSNNNNKSIKVNSKGKKCQNKTYINNVIKSKRLITNKNSTRLLNKFKYRINTLSRANSSWINQEYNTFHTSLEHSISKNIQNKNNNSNKFKINNVIVKNINNYMRGKKRLKISDNFSMKKNYLLNLNNLKDNSTLYYLTNINEEMRSKKKNYNNGNNIFISINNYTNEIKKKGNKSNINLTEGKDINIQNYISKKTISHKGKTKIRRRNYLKIGNKFKVLRDSKNSSQNKTDENFNSINSENDKIIEGPELTHFFIVASIQKGIKNYQNYN